MMAGCGRRESEAARHKVIVLGIDGMDPQLLHRYKQDGRMPNFQRLERDGSFRELRTSVPPQSPVAWSNVITGMNPGGHGVYDFIERDPNTMLPEFSMARVEAPAHTLSLGSWVIPLSSG
jgi:predicted AlkP superfamily phosphohydrolase/phosphomutase